MFDKFNESAKNVIENSRVTAQNLGHTYIGSEHILLSLLSEKNSAACKILENRGVTFENIKNELIRIYGAGDKTNLSPNDMTPRTKWIIQNSLGEAQQIANNYIGTEHILMSLLRESDCVAVKLLMLLNVNINQIYHDILNYFQSQEYISMIHNTGNKDMPFGIGQNKQGNPRRQTPILNQYGKNLTEEAKSGKIDPIIGRDKEMERVIQILSRRTKNNPCLIGEPGVGKTAVVEGLAQHIIKGNVPETLSGKQVVTLDLSSMIAGAKYRGEFEERLKGVMEEIKNNSDIIIFIDEIHTIIGAGAAEGAVDAANILKPALARGDMQVIGATTVDEYRKHIEKDAALERRFQQVMVGEPSEDETIMILKGLRDKYEAHHKVKITDEAIHAAVALSKRYINDRYLPDKAIDLIDEAASKAKINLLSVPPEIKSMEEEIKKLNAEKEEAIRSQDFEKAAKIRDQAKKAIEAYEKERENLSKIKDTANTAVTDENIADIVTSWTNIPVKQLLKEESERLVNLEEELHKRIVGQNEAISAIARAIRRGRVGLKDPKRPIGSFIFLGPTGVGKTEVTKALAEVMFGDENAMIRVDMSEFMEKHSVSKLIGSPPGYVGYDDASQLTEKVRRKPYSIILFDEIEKAHPDVFNILLQIFEDGILTDSHGRRVDFKNTVLIMTSNVGANGITTSGSRLGFSADSSDKRERDSRNDKVMDALKSTFKPEFLNRIDETIIFDKLSNDEIRQIAVNMLGVLKARVKKSGIDVSFDDKCVDFIAKEGMDNLYGARPLRRAIQRNIEDFLSLQMLEGAVKDGDVITITEEDGKIAVKR